MCSTSLAGYQFAMQLKEQHDKEVEVERNQNTADLSDILKDQDTKRQVGEIDYAKHEQTIKKMEREEELAERKAKAEDAATWCPLDHEHGPNCVRPRGDCSHNHQKEIAIYERSTEDKIKAAQQFREAGNALFAEENYGLACVEYRRGLLQYDYTFPEGDDETLIVENAKLALHLNLAACKIHLDDYNEALTNCRCALMIDPKNCKALYRRGIARMGKLEFDAAKKSFLEALDVEPNNQSLHIALKELNAKIKAYGVKSRKVAELVINAPHLHDEANETEAEATTRCQLEEIDGVLPQVPDDSAEIESGSETSAVVKSEQDQNAIHEEFERDELRRRGCTRTEKRREGAQEPRDTAPAKKVAFDSTQKLVMLLLVSCTFFACTTIMLAFYVFFK